VGFLTFESRRPAVRYWESSGDAATRVLTVCTGNHARSPFMEYLLGSVLASTGAFEVRSAGTQALVGECMADDSRRLLEERGIDSSAFRARAITSAMIAEAHLVVTASREHVDDVVEMQPNALSRSFTLLELATIARAAPAATRFGTSFVTHAARNRPTYRPSELEASDIADPFGRGGAAFDAMAAVAVPAIRAVAAHLGLAR
jgi:protein-tyrosine phosphatase